MKYKNHFKTSSFMAFIIIMLLSSCMPGPGSVGGIVWLDADQDGIHDEGEDIVADVNVELYDAENTLVMTTTTDDEGFYHFPKVKPGIYYVKFLAPANYGFTKRYEGDDVAVDSDADPFDGTTTTLDFKADEIQLYIDAGLVKNEVAETSEPEIVYALANYYDLIDMPVDFRLTIEDMLIPDPSGDYVYSMSDQEISQPLTQTDILNYTLFMLKIEPGSTSPYLPSEITACDGQSGSDHVTACAEGAGPMPEGNILLILMKLSTFIPLNDADRYYIYSLTLDADGDPNNNFEFSLPFDWDFYQNTDRWYELSWEPGGESWKLRVSDIPSGNYNAPSQARAFISGDVVGFVVPTEELIRFDSPLLRLSAFAHDGSYSVDNASGDVSGANPAEDLAQPEVESINPMWW